MLNEMYNIFRDKSSKFLRKKGLQVILYVLPKPQQVGTDPTWTTERLWSQIAHIFWIQYLPSVDNTVYTLYFVFSRPWLVNSLFPFIFFFFK